MNNYEFKLILEKAISGDRDALEVILDMYAPLINGNSYINGILDEDLRQHIYMHIIRKISKFRINNVED